MEIFIEHNHSKTTVDIYAREQRVDGWVYHQYKTGSISEYVVVNDGTVQNIKPLLSIPFQLYDQLLKAFITEGANQNLRTDNENLLKGKLVATEEHLKDMRDITMKLVNNIIQP